MITIQLRNRTAELPASSARHTAANVWEVRVPLSDDLARRLRARDLLQALDEATFVVDGVASLQAFVSADDGESATVTVVLP